jgi:hypothetical protein
VQQKLAIVSLSKGESVTVAARSAGVRSRSTIHRWLADSTFLAALDQHKADFADAVEAIRDTVKSKQVPPLVRLKSAQALVELLTVSHDRSGLVDRDTATARTVLPSGPGT